MIKKLRQLAAFSGVLGGLALTCGQALASNVVAFAPPGAGQGGLAVGFDAAGALRAVPCGARGCSVDHGEVIDFPAELRAAIPNAQFSVVGIGAEHRAVVVAVTDARTKRSWYAVVVAPLGSGEPQVVFAGATGFTSGEDGMRRGKSVEITPPDDDGARSIVIGELQEDLSLCGRPALLAPQLLLNTDLKLHPAKVQRLSPEEQARARHVIAQRVDATVESAPSAHLLHAVVASSAIGSPAALTDGNPETTWAENRSGGGRGEFVLMNMPPELPISGLDLQIRPATAKIEHGVAPREFWIASNKDLIRVTMPEDAWKFPGAHYTIPLDPPIQGDCLALVTESAFDESPHARVTFAELGARTEFDGASVPSLVAALAGGGERAQAAAAVLLTRGEPAFEAVAKAFEGLDEGGRRVALDFIDQAPCEVSLPVYLSVLSGSEKAQSIHARDHIRRCGAAAAPFLAAAAKTARGKQQLDFLDELLLSDPARCVDVIVGLLDVKSSSRRDALRVALARASVSAEARPRIASVLQDPKASERVLVEVLRALGDRIGEYQPEAGAVVARLSGPKSSFRTQFLLIGPSAALAATDPTVRRLYAQRLTDDPEPHLRAQALASLQDPADFAPQIRQALRDPDMRVRAAAVRAASTLADTVPALTERLKDDDWPLVRIAAADALADSKDTSVAEPALVRALKDDSPHVRAHVLLALAAHHAVGALPKIRDRLADTDEEPLVRAAAAQALAAMCDLASVPVLTSYALKLADPMADVPTHVVGAAAILALGDLHPADLAKRLAPLRAKGSPLQAQQAADAVLRRAGTACLPGSSGKRSSVLRVPRS